MEQLQSQQSIVRTDFTLKYYKLESLLQEHEIVKITGIDNHVFVRSWVDYVKAKGEKIIVWADGNFESLLEKISQLCDHTITESASLLEYLNLPTTDFILSVDTNALAEADLQQLFKVIQDIDHDAENENAEPSGYSSFKLVLCMPALAKADVITKQLSSRNSAVFQIGALPTEHTKSKDKPSTTGSSKTKTDSNKLGFLKFGVLLLLITGFIGWQFKQEISDKFNTANDPTTADAIESKAEAVPEKKNTVTDQKGTEKDSENKDNATQHAGLNTTDQPQETASSDADNSDTSSSVESQSTGSENGKKDLKKDIDSLAIKDSINSEDLNPDSDVSPIGEDSQDPAKTSDIITLTKAEDSSNNSKMTKAPALLEKVAISAAKNANAVNIGSSLKTQSQSSGGIADLDNLSVVVISKLVDGWMNAWQNQNFEQYQQFYSDDFKSGGQSTHARWVKWRKKRIEKPKWIKLSRSNIKHLGAESEGIYQIQLTLMYSAPNYRDKTFKKMTLKKLSDSTFKIVKEENLKVTKI